MKLAYFQSNIIWEDKAANRDKLKNAITLCQKENVDLLLLPEMSLTGFSMNTQKTSENNNETISYIKSLSTEYAIAIGIGWVKQCENSKEDKLLCENHYSIIQDDKVLLDYTKIHPFSFSGEDAYFVGGESLFTCKLNEFEIGALICYDLRFPEVFQKLSASADLIVVPANWPARRSAHWSCLLRARAIENQTYILGVNCGGQIGDLYYSGDSALIDPNGEEVNGKLLWTNPDISEEKIISFEIQNNVSDIRASFPTKQDRKEDIYYKLSLKKL